MEKDVKIYKQRGDTCASACMMMALEYFKVMEKANWYDEKRYYRIYGSRYLSGTPFSALAFHFSKNGLDTKIFHQDSNLFNNDRNVLSDVDFQYAMREYKEMLDRAKLNGTDVINGIKIDSKLIKDELESGNIVIVAGELFQGCYHAVLISGYDNNQFIICDPLYKTKQIKTEEELNKFMDTSIGKWFISVNNNSKNKGELLSTLNQFDEETQNIMRSENKIRSL